MNRAVFLDRDGTLNVERHYLHDPDQLEIIPGSGSALRRLMDAGYRLFIVTNQSGIGRGYYTEADMHAVNDKLSAELAASDGVAFEKIYFAPESPEEDSPAASPVPNFCAMPPWNLASALSKAIWWGTRPPISNVAGMPA